MSRSSAIRHTLLRVNLLLHLLHLHLLISIIDLVVRVVAFLALHEQHHGQKILNFLGSAHVVLPLEVIRRGGEQG